MFRPFTSFRLFSQAVRRRQNLASDVADREVLRYAQMVKADRELHLARDEAFRFGATDLQEPKAKANVKAFVEALFKRYGIPTS